ncbi:MAG TPA: protein translocase subunit SecD [Pseudomonadales bacterium]
MLNKYPLWKNLLILFVLLLSCVFALPNLYPSDPVVQVSGASASATVDDELLTQMKRALEQSGIPFLALEISNGSALARLSDSETQLKAKDSIRAALSSDYVVALNLAPTTPQWLRALGASPMNLGLDLRGGVHFLLEVDMDKALEPRSLAYVEEIRDGLRAEGIRYRAARSLDQGNIQIKFSEEAERDKGMAWLKNQFQEFLFQRSGSGENLYIDLQLAPAKLKEIQDYAVMQNLTALRNRVNELGVAEPLVQKQGANRIVVELPGVQDTAEAKRIIGRTASLEFRLEDYEHDARAAASGLVPSGSELFAFKGYGGGAPVLVYKKVIVTGDRVVGAQSNFDENGQPMVSITLDGKGGKMMNRATRDNVGRRMAVIFVEHKEDPVSRERYVEKYAINVATIQSALGHNFRITGLDNVQESKELALLLRAGALAAPMYFVEERTVGPSLGQENIDAGIMSVMLGFALVLVFMLAWYKVFGLFANLALVMNVVVLIAVMSLIPGATLTLPGIAGIVLTVGMAVDANVLIFSRIKEELKNGLTPQAAINAGYERAFVTILDANITTLLVALVLFAAGTGPVKGFAVTLSIGILTSMFTAIMGTRALVNAVYGGRPLKKITI